MPLRQAGLHVPLVHAALFAALVAASAPPAFAQAGPPAPVATATAPVASAAVVIQESNGFPGGDKATEGGKLVRQKVTVIDGRLRVLDEAHRWALFVSIPERTVQEVAVDRREYVERDFDFYAKYRDTRAKALRDQAKEFTDQRDRARGPAEVRELEQEYTREGGDPRNPGAIVAKFQTLPGDARKATLVVDGRPLEVTLEHVLIRENQAAVPVFDLWVTKDVRLPINVFAFWNALGTFAPEITRALLQVQGTIVECKAVLDTGTFQRRFESRVLEVRTSDPGLTPADVSLPPGRFTKVDPKAAEAEADAPEQVLCVMTGRLIPAEDAGNVTAKDGREHWVDGRERGRARALVDEGKPLPFASDPRSVRVRRERR